MSRILGNRKLSQAAELSSLFTLSVGRGRETQNCRHFWTCVGWPRLKSAVVIFGLASGPRVLKVSTVTGIGGSWSRNAELLSLLDLRLVAAVTGIGGRGHETQNFRHFWTCVGSSSFKSVNRHRDRGDPGRETQNCRHFWTCVGSPCLKSVSNHRAREGPGTECRTVVTFGRVLCPRDSKAPTVTGIGGVLVAKCRTVVAFGLASGRRVSKVSLVTDIGGGPGRETQNCHHFWTCVGSRRVKSVDSRRDGGVVVTKRRTVVTLGLLDSRAVFVFQKRQQSQGSRRTWSPNAQLSSPLDSCRVFALKKCRQSQEWGRPGRETQKVE